MSTNSLKLAQFIQQHQPLTVITGAGCSVASGIPTYRDDAGDWQRSDPIQHKEFLHQPGKRKRYWARSFSGWPAVAEAKPNKTHTLLTELEQQGYIKLLITQNVDRLHQRSGHQQVIDLHGRLDRVKCLDCYHEIERSTMQILLKQLNPHLTIQNFRLAPDGDADVPDDQVERMTVPDCPVCGGMLKPDVVFYGGGVDKTLVERIYKEIDQTSGILVVGSSLMVFSSYRFCRYGNQRGLPIAILNNGTTRADDLARLKVAESSESVLPLVLRQLNSPG